MDPNITNYLHQLTLGVMQTFQNMAVLPLLTPINGSPEYITLKESLEAKLTTITEVDQSGSVPELRVINTSEQFILLLDGEELMGAKQNRVLNTSILLRKSSETIIPVSCTEQGRWAYTSAAFAHSGTIMSHSVRSSKLGTVTSSLRRRRGHTSDQGRVWSEISRMHNEARTSSPTGALRDVYTAKSEDLKAYSQAFEVVPEQQGSLVFINGEVVGFDIVSRQAAYEMIHLQLIKSYAMDAVLQKTDQVETPAVNKSVQFLQETLNCNESRFDAVGQGYDYRFEGTEVVGSALVCEEKVIHMAFFKVDENEPDSFLKGQG